MVLSLAKPEIKKVSIVGMATQAEKEHASGASNRHMTRNH